MYGIGSWAEWTGVGDPLVIRGRRVISSIRAEPKWILGPTWGHTNMGYDSDAQQKRCVLWEWVNCKSRFVVYVKNLIELIWLYMSSNCTYLFGYISRKKLNSYSWTLNGWLIGKIFLISFEWSQNIEKSHMVISVNKSFESQKINVPSVARNETHELSEWTW